MAMGLGLASGGELAYLMQSATLGLTGLGIVESVATIAALAVASWAASAVRPRALAAALGVAAASQTLQAIVSVKQGPFSISTFPSILVPIGYVLLAWSARPRVGHSFGARLGALVIVVGTMTWWLTSPSNIVSGWFPGEALNIVGFGFVAGSFHEPPHVGSVVARG
jgi:hypothetical protein